MIRTTSFWSRYSTKDLIKVTSTFSLVSWVMTCSRYSNILKCTTAGRSRMIKSQRYYQELVRYMSYDSLNQLCTGRNEKYLHISNVRSCQLVLFETLKLSRLHKVADVRNCFGCVDTNIRKVRCADVKFPVTDFITRIAVRLNWALIISNGRAIEWVTEHDNTLWS